MAKLLGNLCCHSSSTTFSYFHNESLCSSRKLTAFTNLGHFSKWVPKNFARLQLRPDFELRSSNGYPLNAVSLQDGMIVSLFLESCLVNHLSKSCLVHIIACVEFWILMKFMVSYRFIDEIEAL